MKGFLGFLVYTITIGLVLAILTSCWGFTQFTKPGPAQDTALFTVERGHGANAIANNLFAAGLIEDPFIFMIAVTVMGEHRDLKAGEYEIQPAMSAYDIMRTLRDGTTVLRRFTIREGLTSFETVRLLGGVEGLSGEVRDIPPEGSLLPNTYDYQLNEDRAVIVRRLGKNMREMLIYGCGYLDDAVDWEAIYNMPFDDFSNLPCPEDPKARTLEALQTIGDVLTLASIIEKETSVVDERFRVAGVFVNRLKRGMPLQTDPTVIYAITKGEHKNDGRGPLGRRLLKRDLEIDSPYNTYKYPGLPPGPIANPGRASIEAALNPEEHDYIFFVADGTGGHAFAKTLAEHNRNVREWRKVRP